eukprot:2900065-Rhodomonas_salina.3
MVSKAQASRATTVLMVGTGSPSHSSFCSSKPRPCTASRFRRGLADWGPSAARELRRLPATPGAPSRWRRHSRGSRLRELHLALRALLPGTAAELASVSIGAWALAIDDATIAVLADEVLRSKRRSAAVGHVRVGFRSSHHPSSQQHSAVQLGWTDMISTLRCSVGLSPGSRLQDPLYLWRSRLLWTSPPDPRLR